MKPYLIELPFCYRASHVASGGSIVREGTFKDFATIRIREISKNEAPVASKWTGKVRNGHPHASPYVSGRQDIVTRTFEGRSYLPLGRSGFVSPARFVREMAGTDALRSGKWLVRDLPPLPMIDMTQSRGFMSDIPTEYVTEAAMSAGVRRPPRKLGDDRDASLSKAAEAWNDGLLVMDGEIWTSPRDFVLHYEVQFQDTMVALVVSDRSSFDMGTFSVPFRADRRDDAVAFAKAAASASHVTYRDETFAIKVVDANLMVEDQQRMFADRIARYLALVSNSNDRPFEPRTARLRVLSRLPAEMMDRDWESDLFDAYAKFLDDPGDAPAFLSAKPAFDAWRDFGRPRHRAPETGDDEDEDEAALSAMGM